MVGTANEADSSIIPAIDYLRPRLPFPPLVSLVLGSGLGRVVDQCTTSRTLTYAEIPGFPRCSVQGHGGRLHFGTWHGIPIAVLEGRVHRYEGHSLEATTRPIRSLAALGARVLITTCAAGSLYDTAPGTLFLIEDHLNLMGDNPLLAMRFAHEGSARFLEMADAYDPVLRTSAIAAAQRAAIPLERGVLACVSGPVYETAAEAEMLRRLGAQAVNMSVVPEVIAARGLNQRVLGLAVLTNRSGVTVGHSEVLSIAENRCKAVTCLLDGLFQWFPA